MALPFEVWIDTELNVVHSRSACSGAKIPQKYGYLKREYVTTIEQARYIDAWYRACEACRDSIKAKAGAPREKQSRYRKRENQA